MIEPGMARFSTEYRDILTQGDQDNLSGFRRINGYREIPTGSLGILPIEPAPFLEENAFACRGGKESINQVGVECCNGDRYSCRVQPPGRIFASTGIGIVDPNEYGSHIG